MLMWLGFRTLRRENGWFALGWAISVYRVMGQFFRLLANATLLRIEGTPTWMYLTLLIPLLQYICLWQGIRAVQRKAGQEQRAWRRRRAGRVLSAPDRTGLPGCGGLADAAGPAGLLYRPAPQPGQAGPISWTEPDMK